MTTRPNTFTGDHTFSAKTETTPLTPTTKMFFRNDPVRRISDPLVIGRVVDVTGDWVSVQFAYLKHPLTLPRSFVEAVS
jgi:hypothetical protein